MLFLSSPPCVALSAIPFSFLRCLKLMSSPAERRAALGSQLTEAEVGRSRAEQGEEATEAMRALLT